MGCARADDIEPAIGEIADARRELAGDVQWRTTGPGPLAGLYTGKQDIGRFFGKMGETYGDTFRLISWRSAHVYSFENGSCIRFLSFQDDPFIKFWLAHQ